ncbi:MAG: endonuclease domain-containing protein [Candidatus Cloacimonadales bacterium]|nr:endonuclease domain-containing protein [Candidatus Cloacimonadales bacterium]
MAKLAYETARDLRKRSTNAENAFWQMVRSRKFLGLKFKRQCPIEFDYDGQKRFFIADFYCHEKKLVIEIDGGIHDSQKEYDTIRDEIMDVLGLKVIRIKNKEILEDEEKVKKNLTLILS